MTAALAFKLASASLAIAALVCGIMAARRVRQAAKVPVDPGWTLPGLPGPSEPVTPELQQMAWTGAVLAALQKSGEFNRSAVGWTIGAVIFGTAASLASLFPLCD